MIKHTVKTNWNKEVIPGKPGLLPGQRKLLDASDYIVGYVGGYGSGKTRGGAMKAVKLALQNPNCKGGIVSPSYSMGKETAFATFIDVLEDLGYVEGKHFNHRKSSPMGVDIFHTNSHVKFMSGSKPQSMKGDNLAWLWVDEPFIQDEAVKKEGIGRVREPSAKVRQIVLTGTPEELNWGYDYFEMCQNGISQPRYAKDGSIIEGSKLLLQISSRENYYLPADYVDQLESEYDEKMIEAYVNGRFVPLTLSEMFYNYDRDTHYIPLEPMMGWQWFLTWDFNVDPMTCLIGQYDKRNDVKTVHILDEISPRGTNTLHTAHEAQRRLNQWGYGGGHLEIFGDATGIGRRSSSSTDQTDYDLIADVFKQASYRIPSSNPPRISRHNQLNGRLKNKHGVPSIYFNRGKCPELDKDMMMCAYKQGTRIEDTSDKMRGHKADAVEYVIAEISDRRTAKMGARL